MSFQSVFASGCGDLRQDWDGSNHELRVETVDTAKQGESFDVKVIFKSHEEIPYDLPEILTIDLYSNGSIIQSINLGKTNGVMNSGCTVTLEDTSETMTNLDCTLSFPFQFSEAGQRDITAYLHNDIPVIRTAFYMALCNSKNITVPGICPNGITEFDEECDGDASITKTCTYYKWAKGDLKCSSDCKIDTSGCFDELSENFNPLTCNTLGSCFDMIVTVLLYFAIGGVSLSIIIAGAIFITGATPAKLALAKKIILWGIGIFVIMLLFKLVSVVSKDDLTNIKTP
jgi:hypothetical protein